MAKRRIKREKPPLDPKGHGNKGRLCKMLIEETGEVAPIAITKLMKQKWGVDITENTAGLAARKFAKDGGNASQPQSRTASSSGDTAGANDLASFAKIVRRYGGVSNVRTMLSQIENIGRALG